MIGADERGAVIGALDDVRLAVKGAARLALAGELEDEPSLVLIEVAAVLAFTATALHAVIRDLDHERDQPATRRPRASAGRRRRS